jgi:hypothetical protein
VQSVLAAPIRGADRRRGEARDIVVDNFKDRGSFMIPLDADASVQDGWRRLMFGTPDMSTISSFEIHADTWDYGFTLWLDGVRFDAAADFNDDGSGIGQRSTSTPCIGRLYAINLVHSRCSLSRGTQ